MLHKVYPPECQTELRELLRFQQDVLWFALNTSLPLVKKEFETYFGVYVGEWLWERVYYHNSFTEFGNTFENLVNHAKANQSEIKDVFRAFCNDILFAAKWRDPAFQFRYSSLPETWQNVLNIEDTIVLMSRQSGNCIIS